MFASAIRKKIALLVSFIGSYENFKAVKSLKAEGTSREFLSIGKSKKNISLKFCYKKNFGKEVT